MAYSPVEFADSKGLDLRVDPQQAGSSAVDALNVDFDRRGVVRTRDGTSTLYTAAATIDGIAAVPNTVGYVFFGTGSNVYLIDTTTGPPAGLVNTTASTAYPTSRMHSPNGAAPWYFLDGATTVRSVTAAAVVATPGGVPAGYSIEMQTPDRRLVVANAGSTAGKLAFSDAGDFTTFGANNYVTLPEWIEDLVNWNDMLFVFCRNSFYVFYGNSVDSAGEPVFNYRLVSGQIGTSSQGNQFGDNAAALPDGVYFSNHSGIYRTTGGPPVKISSPVEALMNHRSTPPYFVGNGSTPSTTVADVLVASGGRLFVRVGTTAQNGYWLVYDPAGGTWSYWHVANGWYVLAERLIDASGVQPPEARTVFASYNGTSITYMNPAATSDNGTAIVSRYRSGFWNPGKPGAESVVREWLVDGVGTVDFKVAADDAATLGSAASLALGTSPAIAQNRDRRAVRGRNFSFQIGASSGAWSVSRVIANVRGSGVPGEKSS